LQFNFRFFRYLNKLFLNNLRTFFIFSSNLFVFIALLNFLILFVYQITDNLILILKEFQYLNFDLFKSFRFSFLKFPFSSFEISCCYNIINLLLLGDNWSSCLTYFTDIEGCWVLIGASRTDPTHHSHFFLCLLLFLLLLLLNLLNNLFFNQLVYIPTVYKDKAVAIVKVYVECWAKDFTFVLLDYVFHLLENSCFVKVVRNIAYLEYPLPLVIWGGRVWNKLSKFFIFNKVIDFFEDFE
jgi:hypothetical protein